MSNFRKAKKHSPTARVLISLSSSFTTSRVFISQNVNTYDPMLVVLMFNHAKSTNQAKKRNFKFFRDNIIKKILVKQATKTSPCLCYSPLPPS